MTSPKAVRSSGRRHRSIRASFALIVVEFLMFCFSGCLADRLILFPSTDRQPPVNAEQRFVDYSHGRLDVWVARSPGCREKEPAAIVLDFTGNAGRAEDTAGPDALDWGARPVEVWAPNHPGFGQSTGPASLGGMAPAALATYDAIARQYPGKPIFVQGMSLGTTIALHVAANRPVTGMVLRSPLPLRSLILGRHGWWNLWLLAGPVAFGVPGELDSLANAQKANVPAVFVLIEYDSVIPLPYQQKVVGAHTLAHQVVSMSDGDHNDAMNAGTYKSYLAALDWLWQQTMGGAAQAQ
jgi:hypothetical protein